MLVLTVLLLLSEQVRVAETAVRRLVRARCVLLGLLLARRSLLLLLLLLLLLSLLLLLLLGLLLLLQLSGLLLESLLTLCAETARVVPVKARLLVLVLCWGLLLLVVQELRTVVGRLLLQCLVRGVVALLLRLRLLLRRLLLRVVWVGRRWWRRRGSSRG